MTLCPACAQEFLFRGIQKQEWDNLFQFISVKGLPIANLAEAQQGPGGAARLMDLDLDGADIDSGAWPHPPPLFPSLLRSSHLFSRPSACMKPLERDEKNEVRGATA